MTEQEFRERDLDLLSKINDYNLDSADHQAQIAFNNRQAALLEVERNDLRQSYYSNQE